MTMARSPSALASLTNGWVVERLTPLHLSPVAAAIRRLMRQAVHSALKHNRQVKAYRIGNFGEGEMGVTVVELR